MYTRMHTDVHTTHIQTRKWKNNLTRYSESLKHTKISFFLRFHGLVPRAAQGRVGGGAKSAVVSPRKKRRRGGIPALPHLGLALPPPSSPRVPGKKKKS